MSKVKFLDQECEVLSLQGGLLIRLKFLDDADYPSFTDEIIVPCFGVPINLTNVELVNKYQDYIGEILESIADRRYPLSSQVDILRKLCKNPCISQSLYKYCEENVCLCPAFYSVGCISLMSGNIKQSKLVSQIISAISRIYSYQYIASIMNKLDFSLVPERKVGEFR